MSKKHARFSPSALDALAKCIRFKYSDVDRDAASEGTDLHHAYEIESTQGLNDEQANAVQQIIDFTNGLLASEGGPEMWEVWKEVRVELEDLTFGHPDTVLIHKEKPIIHVIDAKFIRMEHVYDFQVRTYGAGVVEALINENRLLHDTQVNTHIAAPRIGLVDSKTYEAGQLLASIRREITELYERIEDPFNPPTPEEDLCGKCARAAKCPALTPTVTKVAAGLGLPVPANFEPDAMVSERDRAIAHCLAGVFEAWAKQIKQNNTKYVKEGGAVAGYKLLERSSGIKVAREETHNAVDALRGVGYTDELILGACTLSVSQLAKAKSSISTDTEAEAKDEIRETLSGLTTENSYQYLGKVKRLKDAAMLKQITEGNDENSN